MIEQSLGYVCVSVEIEVIYGCVDWHLFPVFLHWGHCSSGSQSSVEGNRCDSKKYMMIIWIILFLIWRFRYVHTGMHRQPYLFLAVLSIRFDLLQRTVKEVCDRWREKGELQLLKNRTHKGEESWKLAETQYHTKKKKSATALTFTVKYKHWIGWI